MYEREKEREKIRDINLHLHPSFSSFSLYIQMVIKMQDQVYYMTDYVLTKLHQSPFKKVKT